MSIDKYEELKRRLLGECDLRDSKNRWVWSTKAVRDIIAEVDALAPCVCGETGARNCAVHNEPASVVEAYDRSCKNCGWNSEEGLAKLHCTCEEKCKEDYTRWKPRPPAPKYTCKWCGRKAISEKANTAHESACARKNVPAPAVDEATICANCLNPKAHHYDGFCYPGSGASEQSKFTPRQPAPEKDELKLKADLWAWDQYVTRLEKLEQAAEPLGEMLNSMVTLLKYHLTEHQRVSVQQDHKLRDVQDALAAFEKARGKQ